MANDMATTGFAPMDAQMVLNLMILCVMKKLQLLEILMSTVNLLNEHHRGHTGNVYNQSTTLAGGGTMMLTGSAGTYTNQCNGKARCCNNVTGCCAMVGIIDLALSFLNM